MQGQQLEDYPDQNARQYHNAICMQWEIVTFIAACEILSRKEQTPKLDNKVSWSPRDKDKIVKKSKPCNSVNPQKMARSGARGVLACHNKNESYVIFYQLPVCFISTHTWMFSTLCKWCDISYGHWCLCEYCWYYYH